MIIKIAFVDFWDDFDIYNNFIVEALNRITEVEVIDVKLEPTRRNEVQYLFCSCFSTEFLQYDCIRIFYTGENSFPDFNLYDYAIGFEYATVSDRYLRYPLAIAYYKDVLYMLNDNLRTINSKSIIFDKKFCAMVVSNGMSADKTRETIFDGLSEYKGVDSGGRFRNNINAPEGVPNKIEFMKNYKFSLAIENVSHPGYITEKIFESYAAGTVPIYWGDPKVDCYFNEESFINCMKYDSMTDLLEHVKLVNENDEIYYKMVTAPILKNKSNDFMSVIESYENKLTAFLSNILNQEYEQAYRRNKFGWCFNYERNLVRLIENSSRWETEILNKRQSFMASELIKMKSWIKNFIK